MDFEKPIDPDIAKLLRKKKREIPWGEIIMVIGFATIIYWLVLK